MSLDITLTETSPHEVFSSNITHNLVDIAKEAGIYTHLWRPEEIAIDYARQLVEPLTEALNLLKETPDRFIRLNPQNRWGSYDVFVKFVEDYLKACKEHPSAEIGISR
jgi:hypothetical protein